MSFPQFPGSIQNFNGDRSQITFHQVHENNQLQITAKTESVGISSFFGMGSFFKPENSVGINVGGNSLYVDVKDLAKELNVSEKQILDAEKNGTLDKFLNVALKAKHFGVDVSVFNDREAKASEAIKKLDELHAHEGLVTTNSSGMMRPVTEQELQKIKSTVRNSFHSLQALPEHDLSFHYGKKLGEGGSASVIHRIDLAKGRCMTGEEAILKVPKSIYRDSKQIVNEVKLLNKIHTGGLVGGIQKPLKLVTIATTKRKAPQGHLSAHYEGNLEKPLLGQNKNLAHQLLSGLNYIHSIGITHGDIKPENVFFNSGAHTEDGQPKVYLADFGGAIDHTEAKVLPQENVSMLYRPIDDHIESKNAHKQGNFALYKQIETSCDVFAAASVICTMFTGEIPYNDPSIAEKYQISPNLVDQLQTAGLSLKTIDLLTQSLNYNYENRPQINDLLEAFSKDLSL